MGRQEERNDGSRETARAQVFTVVIMLATACDPRFNEKLYRISEKHGKLWKIVENTYPDKIDGSKADPDKIDGNT